MVSLEPRVKTNWVKCGIDQIKVSFKAAILSLSAVIQSYCANPKYPKTTQISYMIHYKQKFDRPISSSSTSKTSHACKTLSFTEAYSRPIIHASFSYYYRKNSG